MAKALTTNLNDGIDSAIFFIRGEKVMLDRDLAELYGVSTSAFNQAIKRHRERFPEDFMFRLTIDEVRVWQTQGLSRRLRSQTVILKQGQHVKYLPYAFTEHGILMLSSVLNSERAIQVNIEIMRAFVRLRQMVISNADLSSKLAELERKYNRQFKIVFDAIRSLMRPSVPKTMTIGFRAKATEK
jgi:phage regulator Rha-like protein